MNETTCIEICDIPTNKWAYVIGFTCVILFIILIFYLKSKRDDVVLMNDISNEVFGGKADDKK